jgi:hypothetical protein
MKAIQNILRRFELIERARKMQKFGREFCLAMVFGLCNRSNAGHSLLLLRIETVNQQFHKPKSLYRQISNGSEAILGANLLLLSRGRVD